MHGEYKVPDGKLVAVDLEVSDGRLTDVVVSGDFFLEPDDALDDIVQALNGLPHNSSVADLAAAINTRLPEGTRMLGFSPEAVGIAVRRALGHATNWDDHTFDVIGPVTLDPRLHVALDEVLAGRLARGEIGPSLRIWDWNQPLVVIGSFQSYRNEIDEEGRERHGINVVRRITGGGAMFMEPGNCVTYSLLVPGSLVEGLSFERSYEFLDQWVMGALAELGVKARYVPLNDIASEKGKIAGAAQRRPHQRGGAAPRHDGLRHRRRQDAPGAAHRAGEALGQGNEVGEQTCRSPALPDPDAPGRDHRVLPEALRVALLHPPPRLHRRRALSGRGASGK